MSRSASDVVVGLGANLGHPQRQLESAVRALGDIGQVGRVSALYRSAPVGGIEQPDYLNAAVLLRPPMSLTDLLPELLRIERAARRERRIRWGPRTLDLDILWAQGAEAGTATLQVPHPRLTERAFALLPLLDLVPTARDARTGISYADFAENVLRQQDCIRVAEWSGGEWRRADRSLQKVVCPQGLPRAL